MYSRTKTNKACMILLKRKIPLFFQRVSSFFFYRQKAAISVEASVAIPLFIFFVANLLVLLIAFQKYSKSLSEASQKAKAYSMNSYELIDGEPEIVTICETVPLNPLIDIIGFTPSTSNVVVKYRKWTGYGINHQLDMEEDEEYVYITEHGYVYHRKMECSHLKVSISMINVEEVNNYRNSSGRKYTPCQLCGGYSTGALFITSDGDKYHCSAKCSGLRRSIKTVRLSEIDGRGPCSECGYH